jgi:hypothetical protein
VKFNKIGNLNSVWIKGAKRVGSAAPPGDAK